MTVRIAITLPEEAVEFLDAQVSSGAAQSRADFICHAIKREQRRLSSERDLAVLIAAPYPEFDDMHEHVARTGYANPD